MKQNLKDTINDAPVSYAPQWRIYRQRRSLALFFLYAALPVFAVLFLTTQTSPHRPLLLTVVPLLWIAATYASIWWSGEFRCPRCWRRYGAIGSKGFVGLLFHGLFDDICHNCKLRKYTESD
jgi:hypothetical protein